MLERVYNHQMRMYSVEQLRAQTTLVSGVK